MIRERYRPIVGSKSRTVIAYEITTPSAVTGVNSGTRFSDWVDLPQRISLNGYYGVEGCQGNLAKGGNLSAYVEFASGTNILSTTFLWNMNTISPPVEYTIYDLSTATASGEEGGTFYSDYVDVGPVPAGSGYLLADSSFGSDSGGFGAVLYGLAPTPYTHSAGTGVVSLELCDSSGAVITEVEGLTIDNDCSEHIDYSPVLGHTYSTPSCAANCAISWGTAIAKIRVKFVINSTINCRGYGSFEGRLMRVY